MHTYKVPVAASSKKGVSGREYTMEDIDKNKNEKDVWIVVNNKVYDCTKYLELHPGDINSIIINGGEDATDDFVAIHSAKATNMLDQYYVGKIDNYSVKFFIKAYHPCDRFPRGGKMYQHLEYLNMRDTTGIRVPVEEFKYV